jgi:cation:H+ antiporter
MYKKPAYKLENVLNEVILNSVMRMSWKKLSLFVLFLMIIFPIITFALEDTDEEDVNHSLGPNIPINNMSIGILFVMAIAFLIGMIIFTVLLEHSIEDVASKTGSAIGTGLLACASSLPLLVFSVVLGLKGLTTSALIGIIGTNVANLTIVLGVLGLIKPLNIGNNFKKGFVAIFVSLIVVTLVFVTISFSSDSIITFSEKEFQLDFIEGIIIFGLFAIFILFIQIISGKSTITHSKKEKKLSTSIILSIVYGIIVCWAASQSVNVLIHIAKIYDLPQIIIGTVLVVVGTSFPEFAIGIVSISMKKNEEVYGNLITSVIVNLCLGMGIILLFRNIIVDKSLITFQIPFMIFAIIMSVFMISPKYEKLTRVHSLILIGLYLIYLIGIQFGL